MIIEIFPSKRVEGDKKTEIRIPSIDYARILKIRAIERDTLYVCLALQHANSKASLPVSGINIVPISLIP